MMNDGGSMHPTKYAVRCIVHSTVLMSDISCVCKRDTKRDISTWSLTGGAASDHVEMSPGDRKSVV